jgi:hypothetical protein
MRRGGSPSSSRAATVDRIGAAIGGTKMPQGRAVAEFLGKTAASVPARTDEYGFYEQQP